MSDLLDIEQVARSIELYRLAQHLQKEAAKGNKLLEFTREPFLREKTLVDNVVVAFGSYDPLSKAHEALFLKGLSSVHAPESLDELLIVTSTTHFEKKVDLRKNSAIYDRVHALEGFASCYGAISLAFFNNPFFINLLAAVEGKYGFKTEISFIVGADVMQKVVDPESYAKRSLDAKDILSRLFRHRFIVSERTLDTPYGKQLATLDTLKNQYPILNDYANQLTAIDLHGDYGALKIPIQEVSSTLIRKTRNDGKDARSLEAVGISDFVSRRGIYLEDSTKYASFVYARQRFADEHADKPIAAFIGELMGYLSLLEENPELRAREMEKQNGLGK